MAVDDRLVLVKHEEGGFSYILQIEVVASDGQEANGIIRRVFTNGGEITGGDILSKIGQEVIFSFNSSITAA